MPVATSFLIAEVEPYRADQQVVTREADMWTGTFSHLFHTCVHSIVLGSEGLGVMERRATAPAPGPGTAPERRQSLAGQPKHLRAVSAQG